MIQDGGEIDEHSAIMPIMTGWAWPHWWRRRRSNRSSWSKRRSPAPNAPSPNSMPSSSRITIAPARPRAASCRKGPFTGVPFFLKDIFALAEGMPTRQACGVHAAHPLRSRFASWSRAYKRAGLIPLGKTNVPEFGLVGTTEFEALRPRAQSLEPRRIRPAARPAVRRRWLRPAWCRSPMPMMAAARSAFPHRAAGWSASSRRARA